MLKFSVLMSIYHKEKPEFFDLCLQSLVNQSVQADEWVIVKDGPIPDELQAVIDKYAATVNIRQIQLPENRGLGLALRAGVPECSNEIIARMDSDDIAVPERFAMQIKEFEEDEKLDLCGGQIVEFESDPSQPIAERRVPLTQDEIVKYQKKRSAFNHMTVMFKKSKVLEAGNYKDVPLMEDDMLWVDMLLAGAVCKNIDKTLCFVRTNTTMIARRGGLKYYKKYKRARKLILKTGFITRGQYIKTNLIQFFVCIMPGFMRKFVFFKLLHRKEKNKADAEKAQDNE